MNSCLYSCDVFHSRAVIKKNSFRYKIFNWCIDLDELDLLGKFFPFIGINKRGLFSFKNKDFFKVNPSATTLKTKIIQYLRENGIKSKVEQIFLITNLRVAGYTFNPVSFYFCYGADRRPLALLTEVNNTFHEQKHYLFKLNNKDDRFHFRTAKEFYVSPFVDIDTDFEFNVRLPEDQLFIQIDSMRGKQLELHAVIRGEKRKISMPRLLWFFVSMPFVTFKIIAAIHWQAFKLYLKQVPFFKKDEADTRLRSLEFNNKLNNNLRRK